MSLAASIKSRAEIARLAEKWRNEGERIAFTSGVFDLLHIGHVSYLTAIKEKTAATKLIVAVNSDTSVRALKGELRPFVPERERALLLHALACIDEVFVFADKTNKENILAIKPHYYVKASDYDVKTLSSAKYLKSWNGKALTLPMVSGHSTSKLFERIVEKAYIKGMIPQTLQTGYPDKASDGTLLPRRRAVFLDRDGVIVEDCEYLHRLEEVRLLPGVATALKRLNELGYVLIVVTNQPGIGLGYFSHKDFFRVNKKMLSLLSKAGVNITGIYFCPHSKAVGCMCRKPEGELVVRATSDHHLAIRESFFIGDQTSDVETARRLKIKSILVNTGKRGSDKKYAVSPDFKAENLNKAVAWIAACDR
ncbi:hypothetical protein COTS27_01288 [Spirochaetota bacterium]|nr:hypothetical protein COTS27_01288 [Spirochaetota bacterium]